MTSGPEVGGEAGRIVLVVDTALLPSVQEACADLATALAGRAGMPVTVAAVPVAYLDSLGRAREIAGPEGEAHAREGCRCPDDEMKQMAFAGPLNAHPARAVRDGPVPALPPDGDPLRGDRLYAEHCATCHGPRGEADGPGAEGLLPRPSNLAVREYTRERLSQVLWNGVAGTAMPAWRDRSQEDLAALVGAVGRLSTVTPLPELPASLDELGARIYTANCVQCHGENGDGRGFGAAELAMAPTDFTRQRPSLPESLRVLRNGVDGTPMAPWTSRLSEAELVSVAHFVRSFYRGGPPGSREPVR